jgi:hypothetical protein
MKEVGKKKEGWTLEFLFNMLIRAYSDVFLLMKFKQKLSDVIFNVYLVPL